MRRFALVFCLAIFSGLPALAHRLSSASLRLEPAPDNAGWRGRLVMPLRDLATLVPIDANNDAAITWGELQSADAALQAQILTHVSLQCGEAPLGIRFDPVAADTLAGEPCASWSFATTNAPTAPSPLISIRYTLLFDVDADHRCLVRFASGSPSDPGLPATAVLSPDQPTVSFPTDARPALPPSLAAFVGEGVHHIWIGFDHILFLLALLLPSVLERTRGPTATATPFGPVALHVARVVTAFTVAHSITLTLAAFEIVRLPSRLVETIIAASVAIAALNNLIPFLKERTWQVAFGFGLIHGFGFAGVLAELDLPRSAFARGLLGFNLGVEIGQLAIVALFLPVAFAVRHSWFYRRLAFQGGSIAIIGVATLWTAQRAFNW